METVPRIPAVGGTRQELRLSTARSERRRVWPNARRVIGEADVVITGEGRLDEQTPYGKTAAGVARMAREHQKRVIAIAGTIDASFDQSSGLFDAVVNATPDGMRVDGAMRDARRLIASAAERATRQFVRA